MRPGPAAATADGRATWLLGALVLFGGPPQGQGTASAASLHAMMMLKIAPYLTPAAGAPKQQYRVAVVGTDDVAAAVIELLPGKKVGSATATATAVPLERAIAGNDAGSYELLYVAASVGAEALAKIVASHADKPVVLVSLRPGFAAQGGSVQLFVRDNGVRFEVQAEALKKQGLAINSYLLRLSSRGPR
jgi:hypothetical protein